MPSAQSTALDGNSAMIDQMRADAEGTGPGGIERRRHPRVRLDEEGAEGAGAGDRRQGDRRQGDRRQGDRRSFENVRSDLNWQVASSANSRLNPGFFQRLGLKPSRVMLLVVALFSGGLAAYLATQNTTPAVASAPSVAPIADVAPAPVSQILVATDTIQIGQRLSAGAVVWADWPQASLRADYITQADAPDAITEMSGAVARFEIFPGEPIRSQKILQSDQGFLAAVLSPGMRAVSVAISAETASGGFISPNDHVDVVLMRPDLSGSLPQTILHNVRVLAIDTRLGVNGSLRASENPDEPHTDAFVDNAIATLELGPTEAEVIIGSAAMGQISLALRSISDVAERSRVSKSGANEAIRISSPFWSNAGGQSIPH